MWIGPGVGGTSADPTVNADKTMEEKNDVSNHPSLQIQHNKIWLHIILDYPDSLFKANKTLVFNSV